MDRLQRFFCVFWQRLTGTQWWEKIGTVLALLALVLVAIKEPGLLLTLPFVWGLLYAIDKGL